MMPSRPYAGNACPIQAGIAAESFLAHRQDRRQRNLCGARKVVYKLVVVYREEKAATGINRRRIKT